jgi:PAS domain S-box-containing protein
MLWMAGPDGRCTFVNKSWQAFTGRTAEHALGWGWAEAVHDDDRDVLVARCRQALLTREAVVLEFRLRRADGQYRWVMGHGAPVAAGGRFLGYLGSWTDITDRKATQVAVVEAEQRFRRLVEHTRDMIYRVRIRPAVEVEYVAGAVEAITGRTPADFYADVNLPRKSIHPADMELLTNFVRNPSPFPSCVTLRWVHADGRVVCAEHQRVPVYDASGQLVAIEGIARDVTQRVEAQARLETSEDRMRQLAARIQAAREEERADLARELHDEVGQTFTAIKLEVGRVTTLLQDLRLGPQIVDRLQSLVGLTEIGIATVRRLGTSLRPPALDHLGLADAVRWEAAAFRARTKLRCHVRAADDGDALTRERQVSLFRILQEALTNVVRHARASAVHVSLSCRGETFELRIRDNGRGITDVQAMNPRAIGLLGMRERAAAVGGTFSIAGQHGKGTRVTVLVPLSDGPASRRSLNR